MGLRTPRRRISPRTKRRYRAIQQFFRKALGSSSPSSIKIDSSIAVNVTDLKHKIVGLEQQLNEVSKHCRDLTSLETSFRQEADQYQDLSSCCSRHSIDNFSEQREQKTASCSTKHFYRDSELVNKQSDVSNYPKHCSCGNYCPSNTASHAVMISHKPSAHGARDRKKTSKYNSPVEEFNPVLQKHRAQSTVDNLSSNNPELQMQRRSSHCGTIENGDSRHRHNRRYVKHRDFVDAAASEERMRKKRKGRKSKSFASPVRCEEERHDKYENNKANFQLLDQNYILDIVERQYKPVNLFGHRESTMSQFSAPVCRDQKFGAHPEIIVEDPDCSPCIRSTKQHHRSKRDHDVNEMRSICDTRLYSSKRCNRVRRRSRNTEAYEDSELYDLIPVKEKCSPKSRRKLFEESLLHYGNYREVPPSPRSLRPRLNLTTQQDVDSEDFAVHEKEPESVYYIQQEKNEPQKSYTEDIESDIKSYDVALKQKDKQKTKSVHIQTYLQALHETTHVASDQTHNKEQQHSFNNPLDSVLSGKTDKALCEIKDILQAFLLEIKKDTSPQKASESKQNQSHGLTEKETSLNSVSLNEQTYTNEGLVPEPCFPPTKHSGFVPQFSSPCCYPILTVCPMHNCLSNRYTTESRAPCACHVGSIATRNRNDSSKNRPDTGLDVSNMTLKHNNTDELIKEIYKFVTKSPTTPGRKDQNTSRDQKLREHEDEKNVLTSLSVSPHTVSTPVMSCLNSKSCEAIGSHLPSYTSDTRSDIVVLEKLSLEAATPSNSNFSADYFIEKRKKCTLANTLKKFLFRKKKTDDVKELSECSVEMEVEVKTGRAQSLFRRDETYYSQPGQGCCEQLAWPSDPQPMVYCSPPHEPYPHNQRQAFPDRYPPGCDAHTSPHYSHAPQIPLCLKEIEVKSTGTQSERKMSLFKKIWACPKLLPLERYEEPNGTEPPELRVSDKRRHFPTIAIKEYGLPPREKSGLLSSWKKLHAKAEAQIRA